MTKNIKLTKEWDIPAPWGNISIISWGDPRKPPVLLIHGLMDSAATFLLLVEQLPDDYYFVAFDLPGHGRSQPFSEGVMVTYYHMIEVVRRVVVHMKWQEFICLNHSLGFMIATYYNCVFSGKICKMINIDPGPALDGLYFTSTKSEVNLWMNYLFVKYSDIYKRMEKRTSVTYQKAVNLMMKSRNLNEKQAEVVLSRNLIAVGNGLFKFMWEPRLKRLGLLLTSKDSFLATITSNPIPTLNILATNRNSLTEEASNFSENVLRELNRSRKDFLFTYATGGHDVHLTNPGDVADQIVSYLCNNVTSAVTASKL